MNIQEISSIIKTHVKEPLWQNWYIKEKIGEGSFSVVYKIEAQRPTRTDYSALKIEVITADNSLFYDEARKRSSIEARKITVQNESAIMYRLRNSPYIVTYEEEDMQEIYIDGNFEGYLFLVKMELLNCVTSIIKYRKMDFSEINIIRLALDIGRGIKAAHDIGVIHRDIKPGNFFLSPDGVYKLGDFNISKQTQTARTFAGTEGYLAPEVYRAKVNVDDSYTTQADIYSFGICLYQFMNNLYFPFEKTSMTDEAIERRMNGESLPRPENASKEFGDIILKACAFNPKARFRTIDEMLSSLEIVLNSKQYKEPFLSQNVRTHCTNSTVYAETAQGDNISATVYADDEDKDGDVIENYVVSSGETTSSAAIDRVKQIMNLDVADGLRDIALKKRADSTLTYSELGTDWLIDAKGVILKYTGTSPVVNVPGIALIIGKKAFYRNETIREIILPDSVISIDEAAFAMCTNLEKIDFGKSVKHIGKNAFAKCSKLNAITLPDSIIDMESGCFAGCRSLEEIQLPYKLSCINSYSFAECKSLRKISMYNGILSIGDSAFEGCLMMKCIDLPESVHTIGKSAFSSCPKLERIYFSTRLEKIESYAFGGCGKLKAITISTKVKMIGNEAFWGCDSLFEINVQDENMEPKKAHKLVHRILKQISTRRASQYAREHHIIGFN